MTLSTTALDVIAQLSGVQPASPLAELRAQRPEATTHAQGSYAALFDPLEIADLAAVERLATAVRVATLHESNAAVAHFAQRLFDAGANPAVLGAAPTGQSASPRLQAILKHAELLATAPRRAGPADLQALAQVGLSTRAIVTLSQIIAFVSFQVRVARSLQLLGGSSTEARTHPSPQPGEAPRADSPVESSPEGTPSGRGGTPASPAGRADRLASPEPPAQIITPPRDLKRPRAFTVEQLEWSPWLQPLDLADANPKQAAALEGTRGNSPYFRLLARDIDVLTERTATDRGIFYTPGGAPRADRELSAAATSRLNGCIYCASVHARLAAQLGKRPEEIDRLLLKGVEPGTDLGLDERWQAVVDFAVALAATPPLATPQHVAHLRKIGLSDLEILDVGQAGAFFAWANRLMLTLGEPYFASAD